MKANNEELMRKLARSVSTAEGGARHPRQGDRRGEGQGQGRSRRPAGRAREDIRNEKNAAITEMKNKVAELSILVAERILKEKLGDAAAQKSLVDQVMKESRHALVMNTAPLAYRYARSPDGTCPGAGRTGCRARGHVALVADTCANNRDLQLLLNSPVVKADKKEKALGKHVRWKGEPNDRALHGASWCAKAAKAMLAANVPKRSKKLTSRDKNIVTAEVTSAVRSTMPARSEALGGQRHPGQVHHL
jgi:hypothetical protein